VATEDIGQTGAEPAVEPAAPAPTVVGEPSAPAAKVVGAARSGNRFWQWFWRGDAMRQTHQPLPAEAAEFARRARLANEIAERLTLPSEPLHASTDAIVCHLFLQSIHWSLRGISARAHAQGLLPEGDGLGPWDVVAPSALGSVPGGRETVDNVKRAVTTLTFVELAEMPALEAGTLLLELRSVSSALLAELDLSKRIEQALWLQRLLRVGVLSLLPLLVVAIVLKLQDVSEQKRDLAVGKPWHASSAYSGGCHSPDQECSEGTDYFFHTQEETAPWIEFDLQASQTISGVRLDNRKDCCFDRVAPLTVEVSLDQQHWRPVARREEMFKTWRAEFPPVKARWVRLRLEKRNVFHLSRVRILR